MKKKVCAQRPKVQFLPGLLKTRNLETGTESGIRT